MASYIEVVHTSGTGPMPQYIKQLDRFEKFYGLPEKVRLRIWHFACYWQRVVGICEEVINDDDEEDIYTSENLTVCLRSTTRCPAILGVCKESRTTGLAIYETIKGMRTRNNTPIYLNPNFDIIFRGEDSCMTGGTFAFVDLKPHVAYKPLKGTKHLAINLMGLAGKHNHSVESHLKARKSVGLPPPNVTEMNALRKARPTQIEQVAACFMNGITTISVIVGNDEDESEVTLEPMETAGTLHTNLTPREKGALEEVRLLQEGLADHWLERQLLQDEPYMNTSPPQIHLVTVKRKPIPTFHQFQRLPAELQDMIWKCTLEVPKCVSVDLSPISGSLNFSVNRRPAIFFVNRASMHIATNQPFPHMGGTHFFCAPEIDTMRLKLEYTNMPRDFSKIPGLRSVGVQSPYGACHFFGPEAKQFVGLQEVVIIIGNPRSECEMELETLPRDVLPDPREDIIFYHQVEGAQRYARVLENDMERVSKKWKTYQKRRVKQGKSSPDWIIPKVRIANMRPICHTESVYSYNQQCRSQSAYNYQELLKRRYAHEIAHAG